MPVGSICRADLGYPMPKHTQFKTYMPSKILPVDKIISQNISESYFSDSKVFFNTQFQLIV